MGRYARAKDIKVGVIGYGGAFDMGKSHLDEMARAGMTPTAVCEIDPKRLEAAAKDFPGIETYNSTKAMLAKSDVDLLAIITPHNTHAPLAIEALRAGRHVVTEKPMAITTAEVDAMIAAAGGRCPPPFSNAASRCSASGGARPPGARNREQEGTKSPAFEKERGHRPMLSTYHNRHWDGCIMQAMKTIKSGAIGEVFRIDAHMTGYGAPRAWWRTSKKISGGILYDWGVHLLEYSLQMLGPAAEMTEVSGYAKTGYWAKTNVWKKDTNEDEGYAVVRFGNGAWLTLNISSLCAREEDDWLEVRGTKGTYFFDYRHWKLMRNEDGICVTSQGDNPKSEGWRFYQNVADHLVKGKPLVITAEWARRPIHILDLANQSAKKGKALPAKYK